MNRTLSWTVTGGTQFQAQSEGTAQMFTQVQLTLFDAGSRSESDVKALGIGGSIVAPH